jgi:hypothetical protein
MLGDPYFPECSFCLEKIIRLVCRTSDQEQLIDNERVHFVVSGIRSVALKPGIMRTQWDSHRCYS